ncbi:helix-turn-helix domain-containing protein [Streptomyces malaysiensis]|uniref:helix-turn-helix domain-containing protein n=1 Tax=Streptomyces malaysiensis TaxID=92644 RepID=UPI003FA76DD6
MQRLARACKAPLDLVMRARMIELSWAGVRVPAIAAELACGQKTVRRWLHRFNQSGLEGLEDLGGQGHTATTMMLPIRLAVPSVAVGGMVNGAARNAEKPLTVTREQSNQQDGSARVQVDCPGHQVVLGQCKDVAYQLQQLSLVVRYSTREYLRPVRVDHRAVVRGLAGIRPRPKLGHPSLPHRSVDWSQQTTTPTCPYEAISVRSSQ